MSYRVLTPDEQLLIVREKLQAVEALHFSACLDVLALESMGGEHPTLNLKVAERTALEWQAKSLRDVLDELESAEDDE